MATFNIESRLTQLENEVAKLKQQSPSRVDQTPWWEQILGTFADDPVYDEAMQLGQHYRQANHGLPKASETTR